MIYKPYRLIGGYDDDPGPCFVLGLKFGIGPKVWYWANNRINY